MQPAPQHEEEVKTSRKVGRPRKKLADNPELIMSLISDKIISSFTDIEPTEGKQIRSDTQTTRIMRAVFRVPYLVTNNTKVVSKRFYKSNNIDEYGEALKVGAQRMIGLLNFADVKTPTDSDLDFTILFASLYYSEEKVV